MIRTSSGRRHCSTGISARALLVPLLIFSVALSSKCILGFTSNNAVSRTPWSSRGKQIVNPRRQLQSPSLLHLRFHHGTGLEPFQQQQASPPQSSLFARPPQRQSNLFGAVILDQHQQQTWSPSSLFLRLVLIPLAGIFCLPLRAVAKAGTSSSTSTAAATTTAGVIELLKSWMKFLPPKRISLQVLAFSLGVTIVVRLVRLQKRQALDATSEWARYANHPATRARALGSLTCFQLLPLWIATRILSICGKKAQAEEMRTRTGNVFADGLLRLGPLYIKIGQILSCRENLFPPAWIVAMEKLQDKVPSRRGEDAKNLAYEAMGGKEEFDKVFESFDYEPLAAASLGQVHKAVLRKEVRQENKANDDTEGVVAVKIQRAKLRQIYDQDLVVLKKVAAGMDKLGRSAANVGGVSQSWVDIFSDAEEILYREIDYRDEATNARRFADDFGLDIGGKPLNRITTSPPSSSTSSSSSSNATNVATSKDGEPLTTAASWLRTPYVYTDLSTEKVLVMEYVPSIKITNKAKLDAANVTSEEREYLSDMLARSYLRQFCCNLFFSTDPHPGNLGVEIMEPPRSTSSASATGSSGAKPRVRLVFYDFGQAASLGQNQADGILDIMEAIIDLNVERSIEAFQTMGVLKEDANLDMVKAKVADNYKTGKVKANQKKLKRQGYKSSREEVTPNATATSLNPVNASTTTTEGTTGKDSEVMKFFTLPAEYAFVARALSQMDGVGKNLDPDFDFVSSAAPYIVEIKGTGKYLQDEFKKRVSNFFSNFNQ